MKKKLVSSLIVMAMSLAIVAGCSSSGEETSDIVLGTAGTAGTYYVVGAAMAATVNNNSDKLNVIAQPTKGSVENLNLANSGDIQFGMSNADGVYFAANGTNMYKESGKQNISGVMSLYMSAGQIATLKDSGIETYADLKGKKVCLGPPSTTIVEMSKSILEAYGIDPEKDITPYYLAFDEGLQKLTDGEIDATFFVAGVPTSAMMSATSTGRVTLVDVDEDIISQISEEKPYYQPYVIPAGTYTGTDKDINTFKIMTEIFTNSDVPEDVVYDFVQTALEKVDEYKDAHVVVAEISKGTAWNTSAPLHPGAAKYFKEVGVID
ncbi:TAXI family TRAP transporter solute-binding subunit [Proteiniclasticum sp. SCR006]|uniref:TAXI family TRAP transporter solute-binding subunit n=1 Tax=Proteiniclasticum aestuarii TaxID=2817862 RepID=A0A939HCJ1_9CLOT|nr:TAXI family TRAP transporter solute-binding subunit [Proteiniclasticum aestuarii]MBO1265825.1 TAXI family TRAP transporter solute-binding subunit [Proteiniclasticum aestuarii]